MHKENAKIKHI